MPVLLLVGMPGAGKEEFVKVAKEMGYSVIRMGDVVREYVSTLGYPIENEIVGKIAGDERDKHGVDVWAKRAVDKIKKMKTHKIVIDGIRCPEEVEVYKREIGDVIVVGIYAPQKERYERIIRRRRPDDVKNWDEFIDRENRELSWGLGEVFARSDVMLLNTGTLEEYHRKVRDFLKSIE